MSLADALVLVCEHCSAGHLQPQRVTLARWVDGRFIIVPGFPAWVCDLCGNREYDSAALEQLQAALRRGPRPPSGARRRPAPGRAPGRFSV